MDKSIRGVSDELWSKVDAIDGWLFREEADLLYTFSKAGLWMELGSYKGKSTVVMAQNNNGVAIDWFKGSPEHPKDTDTHEEFIKNTQGLPHFVITLSGRMEEVIHEIDTKRTPKVKLLYLDAEHSYEATKLAFDLYEKFVDDKGYVIFHDAWGENGETDLTPWPGVTKFVNELCEDENWENIHNVRRCAVFIRV